MSVDERARHQLYNKAIEIFGEQEAEILMAHLPLGGSVNLATKQDAVLLKQDLRAAEDRLRTEIHRVARTQLLAFATIVALFNGAVFAALKLA